MSNNINYEELKIFINKHKNYFGKNLDSALKIIKNTEENTSTAKPINILNQLEDLNIKRGDAKFNSEVRPELRKLLGLDKKTPPTLPKRKIKIDHDKIKRLINQKSNWLSTGSTGKSDACKVVDKAEKNNIVCPEDLYVNILNALLPPGKDQYRSILNDFKYLLRLLLGINTERIAKTLEKKLNKIKYMDEKELETAWDEYIEEFDKLLKNMPEWCKTL